MSWRSEIDGKRINDVLGEHEKFAQGDVACAYGAILGGCDFFAGYPITPATEVAEAMSQLLPRLGLPAIQMEDEIASVSAVVGAAWSGCRAMTATSGPGFSLMQEGIGYACMTETPCVIIDVQRSGPSTGQPTEPAQGDMMQARWGTHGDHEIIALAPASVQECVDLTILAFNLAERYRNPVVVMTDGEIGHMREKIVLPDATAVERSERPAPTVAPADLLAFGAAEGEIPEMPAFGTGYHTYVTGLTHRDTGLPTTDDAIAHTELVTRLCDKISNDREKLTRVEIDCEAGAEVGLVSYGISGRSATGAVRLLRAAGHKVNHLRLVGVFPFPENTVRSFADGLGRLVVPELNLGQICHPVREAVEGGAKVEKVSKIGGEIIRPDEIVEAVLHGGVPV